jgi:hypothetical protein
VLIYARELQSVDAGWRKLIEPNDFGRQPPRCRPVGGAAQPSVAGFPAYLFGTDHEMANHGTTLAQHWPRTPPPRTPPHGATLAGRNTGAPSGPAHQLWPQEDDTTGTATVTAWFCGYLMRCYDPLKIDDTCNESSSCLKKSANCSLLAGCVQGPPLLAPAAYVDLEHTQQDQVSQAL